jgi:hypothetical protein
VFFEFFTVVGESLDLGTVVIKSLTPGVIVAVLPKFVV